MSRDKRGNRTQEVVGSIPISSTTNAYSRGTDARTLWRSSPPSRSVISGRDGDAAAGRDALPLHRRPEQSEQSRRGRARDGAARRAAAGLTRGLASSPQSGRQTTAQQL